jgi:hypothetical protein
MFYRNLRSWSLRLRLRAPQLIESDWELLARITVLVLSVIERSGSGWRALVLGAPEGQPVDCPEQSSVEVLASTCCRRYSLPARAWS